MAQPRILQLEEMLKTEPSDAFLNHALGIEYFSLGNFEKAKAQFEKVISENENYLASYFQLGQTFEKMNLNPEAIKIYYKGILLAEKQINTKALNELKEALWMIED